MRLSTAVRNNGAMSHGLNPAIPQPISVTKILGADDSMQTSGIRPHTVL